MNCPEFREWLDDLLLRDPDEAPPADDRRCTWTNATTAPASMRWPWRRCEAITPGVRRRRLAAAQGTHHGRDPGRGARRAASTKARTHRARFVDPGSAPRTCAVSLAVALAAAVLLAMILFPIGVRSIRLP